MDLNMPIMDGFTATLHLRNKMSTHQIKEAFIVGTSALVTEEIKKQCYKEGMDLIEEKPFGQEKTKEMIVRSRVDFC